MWLKVLKCNLLIEMHEIACPAKSNVNDVVRTVLNFLFFYLLYFFFLQKDFACTKSTKSTKAQKHKDATKQKHKTLSEQK